jgi:predicted lipoprotein with Yx(FWY)xxD motif
MPYARERTTGRPSVLPVRRHPWRVRRRPWRVRRRQCRVPLVLVAVTAVLLVGCGSSSGTPATSSSTTPRNVAPTTSTTSGAPTSTTAGGTPALYEVRTGTVSGLGTVLVDGQGFTVYLFVPDKQSGTSTCYGDCAQGWPPLLLPTGVTVPVAGPGVQSSLLGITHRTDGTTQVTYNKWPLYLWVNDSQPGQATGQGINNLGGLWYVLSPNGRAITTHP